jgi:hypothetical protein
MWSQMHLLAAPQPSRNAPTSIHLLPTSPASDADFTFAWSPHLIALPDTAVDRRQCTFHPRSLLPDANLTMTLISPVIASDPLDANCAMIASPYISATSHSDLF